MPYKHSQPEKRKGNHPIIKQIHDAGKAADASSNKDGCSWLVLIFVLCIPALVVLLTVYNSWVHSL